MMTRFLFVTMGVACVRGPDRGAAQPQRDRSGNRYHAPGDYPGRRALGVSRSRVWRGLGGRQRRAVGAARHRGLPAGLEEQSRGDANVLTAELRAISRSLPIRSRAMRSSAVDPRSAGSGASAGISVAHGGQRCGPWRADSGGFQPGALSIAAEAPGGQRYVAVPLVWENKLAVVDAGQRRSAAAGRDRHRAVCRGHRSQGLRGMGQQSGRTSAQAGRTFRLADAEAGGTCAGGQPRYRCIGRRHPHGSGDRQGDPHACRGTAPDRAGARRTAPPPVRGQRQQRQRFGDRYGARPGGADDPDPALLADRRGIAPTALQVSADGATLYAACGGINAVAVIETAHGQDSRADSDRLVSQRPCARSRRPLSGGEFAARTGFGMARRSLASASCTPIADRWRSCRCPNAAQLASYTTAVAENNRLRLAGSAPETAREAARNAAARGRFRRAPASPPRSSTWSSSSRRIAPTIRCWATCRRATAIRRW